LRRGENVNSANLFINVYYKYVYILVSAIFV
jgi:hypothetical protein